MLFRSYYDYFSSSKLTTLQFNSKQLNVRCQNLGNVVECTGMLKNYIARAVIVESFQKGNNNDFF